MAFGNDFLFIQRQEDDTFVTYSKPLRIHRVSDTIEHVEQTIDDAMIAAKSGRNRDVDAELGIWTLQISNVIDRQEELEAELRALKRKEQRLQQEHDDILARLPSDDTEPAEMAELLQECNDRLENCIDMVSGEGRLSALYGKPVYVAMAPGFDYDKDGDKDLSVWTSWRRRPIPEKDW